MSRINFSNLLAHAGDIFQHLSRAYGHRSQLASLEAVEARHQLMSIGLLVLGALALGVLGLFIFALTLAAFVWPLENRVQILGGVTGLIALVGFISAFVAWRRLHTWSPWPETRRQLHEDCACLSNIITDANPNTSS